jgi:hypothetical protein
MDLPRRAVVRTKFLPAFAFLAACSWLPRAEVKAPRPAPMLAVEGDATRPTAKTKNVILVTIDGVRWQDVFGGVDPQMASMASMKATDVVGADELMPNLYALAKEGAVSGAPDHGAPMMASGPNYVSLPGYMEIFTGSRQVGCRTNGCEPTKMHTMLDEARERLAARDEDVAVISSWESIANAASSAPHRIAMSAGRHGGVSRDKVRVDAVASRLLDEGAAAAAAPGDDDYRPDSFTAALALRYVETARPRVLSVNLGDTDEYAHAGDYASYVQAIRRADRFLGDLRSVLSKLKNYGEYTTIVVTCDHGRSASFRDHGWDVPESGRVWMVASGGAVPAVGYVTEGGAERLADIAPTMQVLLGLQAPHGMWSGTPIAAITQPSAPAYVAKAGGNRELYR